MTMARFWIFRWLETLQSLCAISVSLLHHLHCKNIFSCIWIKFLVFPFVVIVSSPATGHHWEESGSLFFLYQVFRHLLFPGLNSTSSPSVPLYETCLNSFTIFTMLYWTCSNSSISLSHWEAQNCFSHLFLVFLMVGMGVSIRRKGHGVLKSTSSLGPFSFTGLYPKTFLQADPSIFQRLLSWHPDNNLVFFLTFSSQRIKSEGGKRKDSVGKIKWKFLSLSFTSFYTSPSCFSLLLIVSNTLET